MLEARGCPAAWSAAGPASPRSQGRPFSQVPCEPVVWAMAQPVEYFLFFRWCYFHSFESVREEEVVFL